MNLGVEDKERGPARYLFAIDTSPLRRREVARNIALHLTRHELRRNPLER